MVRVAATGTHDEVLAVAQKYFDDITPYTKQRESASFMLFIYYNNYQVMVTVSPEYKYSRNDSTEGKGFITIDFSRDDRDETEVSKHLTADTIDFLRRLRGMVLDMAASGWAIQYSASTAKRKRLYDKVLGKDYQLVSEQGTSAVYEGPKKLPTAGRQAATGTLAEIREVATKYFPLAEMEPDSEYLKLEAGSRQITLDIFPLTFNSTKGKERGAIHVSFFYKDDPSELKRLKKKPADRETLQFMRKLKTMVKEFMDRGWAVNANASSPKRNKFYRKVLKSLGMDRYYTNGSGDIYVKKEEQGPKGNSTMMDRVARLASKLVATSYVAMPVNKFETLGNWNKSHSFRHEDDRKLLTNPKAVEKIRRKLAGTPHPFDFYFVNKPGLAKYIETGFVTEEFVRNTMKLDIQPDPDAITIIFTNNSGAERMPMTAWTIAHRIGHALYAYKTRENTYYSQLVAMIHEFAGKILNKYFNYQSKKYTQYFTGYGGYGNNEYKSYRANDKEVRRLFEAIGTMKSARDNNLRNTGEFAHELMAQYLTQGRITFKVPDKLYMRSNYGRKDYKYPQRNIDQEQLRADIEGMAESLTEQMQYVFDGLEGSILVM